MSWHVGDSIRGGGGYSVQPVWSAGDAQWRTGVEPLYAALGVAPWNAFVTMAALGARGCGQTFDRTRRDKQFCGRSALRGRRKQAARKKTIENGRERAWYEDTVRQDGRNDNEGGDMLTPS